jgi:hypothetical protein
VSRKSNNGEFRVSDVRDASFYGFKALPRLCTRRTFRDPGLASPKVHGVHLPRVYMDYMLAFGAERIVNRLGMKKKLQGLNPGRTAPQS